MRIKLYENFIDKLRNKKKVRQDLEDIFVELGDVGYSVKVNVLPYDITPNTHYEVILISGTVRNSVIDFNEVSEYFMIKFVIFITKSRSIKNLQY